jgi:serine/threonine protein kinase
MCTFEYPFNAGNQADLTRLITTATYDPIPEGSFSRELIDLQRQMLQVHEKDRPTSKQVVKRIRDLINQENSKTYAHKEEEKQSQAEVKQI